MNYPDDEGDAEKIALYSDKLSAGENIPEVIIFEEDGEFYLESGLESALAYSFNMNTFIPAKLVRSSVGTRKFVKMKNSL